MSIQTRNIDVELLEESIIILLADDDVDDCMFFTNALNEISGTYTLIIKVDGEAVMNYLNSNTILPDIIFLDMNMPCKNGFECLVEIKQNERLKSIPVIIISTSLESILINALHQNGAYFYIRKPNLFAQLKSLIFNVINAIKKTGAVKPSIEDFVITVENIKS